MVIEWKYVWVDEMFKENQLDEHSNNQLDLYVLHH